MAAEGDGSPDAGSMAYPQRSGALSFILAKGLSPEAAFSPGQARGFQDGRTIPLRGPGAVHSALPISSFMISLVPP